MKQKFLLFALAVSMIFTACSSDDDPIVITSPVTISFEMPLNLENVEVQSSVVTLTNTATGIQTTLQNAIQHVAGVYSLNVEGLTEGTYRLKASGVLTYTVNGETYPTPFEIEQDNIALSLSKTSARITISTYTAKGGFVLSEIFFTGTLTAEGKQYTNDQYVVITNNSTETLYADGLALLESSFLSTNNYQYVPDTNNDVFAVGAVYVIPGNGQDHPVEPGKSITIAVNAINHTEQIHSRSTSPMLISNVSTRQATPTSWTLTTRMCPTWTNGSAIPPHFGQCTTVDSKPTHWQRCKCRKKNGLKTTSTKVSTL